MSDNKAFLHFILGRVSAEETKRIQNRVRNVEREGTKTKQKFREVFARLEYLEQYMNENEKKDDNEKKELVFLRGEVGRLNGRVEKLEEEKKERVMEKNIKMGMKRRYGQGRSYYEDEY